MMNKSIKTNALMNIIKQLCSISFPLITFPYISRVLGSENYGKYNFGISIVNYFSLIAALGIANYAIREGARLRQRKQEFERFSNEIFSINVVTTIISYILLFLILIISNRLYGYSKLILLQSTIIIFNTIGVDWINSIYEDYTYITLRYVIFQIISIILLFILVKQPNDYFKYAFIVVLASVGANVLNIFHIRKYVKIKFILNMNFYKHIIPMIILFCNSLAVTIYVNSDTTLLGLIENNEIVGLYSIAVKIYMVIKQLLNAMIIVAIPRLSLLIANDEWEKYNDLINKIFKICLTLILPIIVGLFILSKDIILVVGGEQYINGYMALRILSIALFFAVFACFFTNSILLINRKEKYFLKATILASITNLLVNFIAIPMMSLNGAAMTTVIAEFIVLMTAIYYSKGDYKLYNIHQLLFSCIFGCISIISICIFLQYRVLNVICRIFLSIILSIILYGSIMILFKNEVVMQILYDIITKIKNQIKK